LVLLLPDGLVFLQHCEIEPGLDLLWDLTGLTDLGTIILLFNDLQVYLLLDPHNGIADLCFGHCRPYSFQHSLLITGIDAGHLDLGFELPIADYLQDDLDGGLGLEAAGGGVRADHVEIGGFYLGKIRHTLYMTLNDCLFVSLRIFCLSYLLIRIYCGSI
jgi:hypothetical protein